MHSTTSADRILGLSHALVGAAGGGVVSHGAADVAAKIGFTEHEVVGIKASLRQAEFGVGAAGELAAQVPNT